MENLTQEFAESNNEIYAAFERNNNIFDSNVLEQTIKKGYELLSHSEYHLNFCKYDIRTTGRTYHITLLANENEPQITYS
jgi:hypothetical protein